MKKLFFVATGLVGVAAAVVAFRQPPAQPSGRVSDPAVVETLISDAKGDATALDVLFEVRPDVLNHNLETVARLQRAVRPSAGYARSLDSLWAMYQWLDRAPLGRNEHGMWWRHHDAYGK